MITLLNSIVDKEDSPAAEKRQNIGEIRPLQMADSYRGSHLKFNGLNYQHPPHVH